MPTQGRWCRVAGFVALLLADTAAFAQAPMQVFHAVSTAMEPSVLKGEAVLIDAEYYHSHTPSRGDVVMLIGTRDKNEHLDRIIGLPGDRVQLRGGRLFINDNEAPRRKIEDYVYHFEIGVPAETLSQYVEALPTGANGGTREHRIVTGGGSGSLDDPTGMLNDTEIFEVPADHYFVLGDNRDHSADSRTSLGFVPAGAITGRAISHAGADIE
jgi:signal peptidase I